MGLYADVIIDISHNKLDQTFQYRIPPGLEASLEPGDVVEMPFGRGDRQTKGYVLRISPTPACAPEKIKTIVRRVNEIGNAQSKLTALALWMRDYYGSTTVQALRTVLPFRSRPPEKKKKRVVLVPGAEEAREQLSEFRKKHQTARARLLEALIEEPVLPQEAVTGALRITQPVLRTMEQMGIIRCESEQVYRTPAILEQLRTETISRGQKEAQLEEEAGRGNAGSRSIAGSPEDKEHRQSEHGWSENSRSEHDGGHSVTGLPLTEEQQAAIHAICDSWDTREMAAAKQCGERTAENEQMNFCKNTPSGNGQNAFRSSAALEDCPANTGSAPEFLLYGVTGSGKTAVYMELIAEALRHGQQAILLIPEISLTYQNVVRFYHAFGDRISILHSRLSQAERYDQFERAKSGDIDVMIGPRSALFTPFERLGLIIIDEEHEPSYKSETTPRYDAREVARKRAALEGAILVLGSATPSLESYDRTTRGMSRLLKMEHRPCGHALPTVSVVDMRKELQEGNSSILSRSLLEKMREVLGHGQQSMLFINRRGYAGFVSCRSCGHVMKCPHCDVSLSLHRGGRLVCHYCGYTQPAVNECPVCGSQFIGGFKAGTQQIESVVAAALPGARILRMDADTTRGKDGHAEILRAFGRQEADILIGTQMIVKGHDFPGVALVGALAADLSLNISDFRAAERTYQLLAQAAGRAGRGNLPGEVVIQTYRPDHYAITCAAAQTYEPFFEQEMEYRRLSGYPPAGSLMSVHCSAENQESLQKAVGYLARFARQLSDKCQAVMMGPTDEPVAKIKDMYRMVLYIRHRDAKVLTMIKNYMEQYIEINSGFHDISINFER
ncbi:MAG: primosomal protein N' [Lachnospiraceae bacterium]|nr:primosomal protein N' [Lachnospiraceae bacterium]